MADEQDSKRISKQAVYTVPVEISVVLGKAVLRVNQLLKLGRGAVVELEQKISEPVEIYANDILVARGEVIITDGDKIGVTLTELVRSTAQHNG
ncbi:FliM/FliN family flagellar motor switch protein [Rhodospirillum rubrum]|uniref:Flagellar motor switch protein FliN n=1 Tax=Rhodospirillum rubrum (strain ATCC 11170 / ATH 1.1.1 / DSM 467 / LMG 4362 / NCIMB 8255 / S1) TaxID=269796 RepID=Q2RPI0_RHORT|nr:FliM/FliN family flagellar motor switch protein [Rhodospirillum rubrum]ABC23965.1 Surface presentation of antigens (SPOA) protein [Rhodospirillum rubrum ATCC 11170]AEO49710.1 surface presentation of antigens (SPOA) protein [Rhodospirillum rubrum F11]MBK1663450.1 flagellar motor switch protein FliN [Rhodospirillum rubrum]MBK1675367.1 flagellar motor switch protein FliN [Rhodospirillum rubrum]MBK5955646.1 flagellar motor switch protein FliN [Rhodospirillum rubrum]